MHPETIGPYHIQRELGRGGMGEVYLARDTRLDRQVAIKALPAHLAQDPDRLARFQREAKVLASLNHPGIAAIYGLEEVAGHQYLILEFVEGETLADRLASAAIPVPEALSLAKQIAEALEVAHEKGIIHRDLKPGNVMVTDEGVVKVLDFGLARTAEGTPSSSMIPASPDSPTLTSPVRMHSPTIPGAIMGTAGYMSPEQARGKPVDKRSDIFSFGCVLYEMLTGNGPFPGETVADSLGAIIHREPQWSLIPPHTPGRVKELVRNCLAKDRRNRLHDMGDARLDLERAIASPRDEVLTAIALAPWWRAPAVLASAALLAATALLVVLTMSSFSSTASPERSVIRSTLAFSKGMTMPDGDRSVAVSPDGQRVIVVLAPKDGVSPSALYVRDLSRLEMRLVPGTQDATYPFFSPDGRSIGFFAERKLKRVDLADGVVRILCDAPAGRGASWGTKGTIVFAPGAAGGLSIVSDSGGVPTPATEIRTPSESHRVPQMLPDGHRFLYFVTNTAKPGVYAFDPATKQSQLVIESDTEAMFVEPSSLVYARDENVLRQPFDLERLALTGSPTPIAPGVQWDARRASLNLGLSAQGTMVYQPVAHATTYRLAWLDRKGQRTPIAVEPFAYDGVGSLSADGRRVGVNIAGSRGESRLAVIDLERGVRTPLGDPKSIYYYGSLISPDGQRVMAMDGNAQADCIISFASGGGAPVRLFDSMPGFELDPTSITADGRTLLFTKASMRDKVGDIMVLDLENGGDPKPFMHTPEAEWNPRLSPEGDLVSYGVNQGDSISAVIKVATFPTPSVSVQVSSTPAVAGYWIGTTELAWMDTSRRVWSATVTNKDGRIEVGTPKPMFNGEPLDAQIRLIGCDISRDRSLIAIEDTPREEPRLIIVSDWRPDSADARAGDK